MKSMILAAAFAFALSGSASSVSSQGLPLPQDRTFCIRHDGSIYRPKCNWAQGVMACACGADYHISEPYCEPREQPAASTPDANKARYTAAATGKLESARYEGRRFYVPLQRTPRNAGRDGARVAAA